MWARNAGILFFGQNLLFFTIFWTKFKIEKIFIFFDQFCSPPIFSHICVGDFMQNFRTVGLILKKVRDHFNLTDKHGKIIRCVLFTNTLAPHPLESYFPIILKCDGERCAIKISKRIKCAHWMWWNLKSYFCKIILPWRIAWLNECKLK